MGERRTTGGIDEWAAAYRALAKAGLSTAPAAVELWMRLERDGFEVRIEDSFLDAATVRRLRKALRDAGFGTDATTTVGEHGWAFGVTLPDEAAKASAEFWADRLDARPLGTAQEERQWAREWLRRAEESMAQVAGLANQLDSCRMRAEKAEAALAAQANERDEARGSAERWRGKFWYMEAELRAADAALAAQAKRPTAGDRVRGLDAAALASASTAGASSMSEFCARIHAAKMLIQLIATELDKQDAARHDDDVSFVCPPM